MQCYIFTFSPRLFLESGDSPVGNNLGSANGDALASTDDVRGPVIPRPKSEDYELVSFGLSHCTVLAPLRDFKIWASTCLRHGCLAHCSPEVIWRTQRIFSVTKS